MKKEDCLNELKVMFYEEVALYIKKANEVKQYEMKLSILESLQEDLNTFDLNELYDKRFSIYSTLDLIDDEFFHNRLKMIFDKVFYSYFSKQGTLESEFIPEVEERLSKAKEIVNTKYSSVNAEYLIKEQERYDKSRTIKRYKSIHRMLKEGEVINRFDQNFILEYMNQHKAFFTSEKQVLVTEAIRLHNFKYSKNVAYVPESTVEKMINTRLHRFEISDLDEEEFNKKYYNMSMDIYHLISSYDIDENLEDIIEILPVKENAYSPREIKYIYNVILNAFIDDILECVDAVSDINSYVDRDIRNTALLSYKDYMTKYYVVFKTYKKEINKYGDEALDTNIIEEQEEERKSPKEYINKLVYLENNGVSQIERDLKSINNEYYDRLLSLLERKKEGVLPSSKDSIMKNTNDKLKGFGKLEEDQVRILYKPMGNNVYLIIGAFVKKATSILLGYTSLAKRYENSEIPSVEVLLERAPSLEESLKSNVEENGRKSSR